MSDQTRAVSLVEVCLNVALGFCISLAFWPWIADRYGIDYSVVRHIGITIEFTVLSVARGYIVRRFFARKFHELAIRIARRWVYGFRN